MFQGERAALEHKHPAAVSGGGEPNGGLPGCNMPIDARKVRVDPKSGRSVACRRESRMR